MIDVKLELLLPSWWEIEVTVVAAAFVMAAYWYFFAVAGGGIGRSLPSHLHRTGDGVDDKAKNGYLRGDAQTKSTYLVKVALLAAKNLIAANLNGTSDPYAIITCGMEKRFRFTDIHKSVVAAYIAAQWYLVQETPCGVRSLILLSICFLFR